MIKKTIEYVDVFGEKQTTEAWFHLTQKEAMGVMGTISTDWDTFLDDLKNARISFKAIYEFADKLILTAYGIRQDGKYKKSQALREDFEHSEAYSKFFMRMMNTDEGAKEFFEFMEALTPKQEEDRVINKPAAARPSVVENSSWTGK